jgi:hypothetical protein
MPWHIRNSSGLVFLAVLAAIAHKAFRAVVLFVYG